MRAQLLGITALVLFGTGRVCADTQKVVATSNDLVTLRTNKAPAGFLATTASYLCVLSPDGSSREYLTPSQIGPDVPFHSAWCLSNKNLFMVVATGTTATQCGFEVYRLNQEQRSILSRNGTSVEATKQAMNLLNEMGSNGIPVHPLMNAMIYESMNLGHDGPPPARRFGEPDPPPPPKVVTPPFYERFHYDLLPLSDSSVLVFLALEGRMVVWYFQFDEQGLKPASQPAPYGPPMYPKAPWLRVGNFAIPFKGPFNVFAQADSWHFASEGQVWSMPRIQLKEDRAAFEAPLLKDMGFVLEDLDQAYGPIDKTIVLTRLSQVAEVRAVIQDSDNQRLFWLTDSEIIDAAAPAKRVPVPAAARGALTQPPADDPFAGVLPCWRLVNASAP